MRINIIGAGMAGLLAANILRRHDVRIYEKQKELPNNHHAVLRFRTPSVGDVLGIPFKKVNMLKTYVPNLNIVADSLAYSRKTTGFFSSDRSIIEGTVSAERYVAPPDLINQMSRMMDVEYNKEYDFKRKKKHPIISTIPMPILMKILKYKCDEKFNSHPGTIETATINDCNAYISVLFPGPCRASRATITGDQLIIEFPGLYIPVDQSELDEIGKNIGLENALIFNRKYKRQDYFKILPINETVRHQFMKWASVHHNIYSLGRYACWRPKLLLDDLIKDIRIIESWMLGGKR